MELINDFASLFVPANFKKPSLKGVLDNISDIGRALAYGTVWQEMNSKEQETSRKELPRDLSIQ